jgi:hypothetical protein
MRGRSNSLEAISKNVSARCHDSTLFQTTHPWATERTCRSNRASVMKRSRLWAVGAGAFVALASAASSRRASQSRRSRLVDPVTSGELTLDAYCEPMEISRGTEAMLDGGRLLEVPLSNDLRIGGNDVCERIAHRVELSPDEGSVTGITSKRPLRSSTKPRNRSRDSAERRESHTRHAPSDTCSRMSASSKRSRRTRSPVAGSDRLTFAEIVESITAAFDSSKNSADTKGQSDSGPRPSATAGCQSYGVIRRNEHIFAIVVTRAGTNLRGHKVTCSWGASDVPLILLPQTSAAVFYRLA